MRRPRETSSTRLREAFAAIVVMFHLVNTGSAVAQGTVVQLVARTTIYPGEALQADKLVERKGAGNASGREAIASSMLQVAGKVAKRTILAGQPIALSALRDVDLVLAGKKVVLSFVSGSVQISCEGIAMQSGAVGDIVSVQNSDSSVVVRGRVQPDGQVRVGE